MLFVEDLKRAKRFYGDLLGLTPEEHADDFASYRVGPSSLQLHPAGQPFPGLILGRRGPGVSVQVTLDVEDVDTAVNYLRAEGVQVFSEPQDRDGKRDAGVLDPDGNEIYLSQSPG